MAGFLSEVAAALYARYGEELSSLELLFPSRRARIFFADALSELVGRPLWQPRWTTVDELMSEISGLRTADRVRLVTELYKIYREFHDEPFDRFYFWGEMLLSDFDSIDKYRVDADMLLRNLSELKELEADLSYLTPEQQRLVRSFWSTFGEEADLSEEKRRFLALWKTLRPLYHCFRQRLEELGIAYGGMMQRAAIERLRSGEFRFDRPRRFVVAGFNALSECEKELFKHLASAAGAEFYWDFDDYYRDDTAQEAGMFVRRNVVTFPSAGAVSHDNFRREKELVAVSCVSNAVQCKYVGEILRELNRTCGPLGKETAVVLTDENLLLPLLYALPEEVGTVNVTMGYPLRQTLAYSFVERLVELQHRRRMQRGEALFYHADVTGLLAHPYVSECDAALTRELADKVLLERRITVGAGWLARNPFLKRLFRPADGWRELSDWLLATLDAVARLPFEGDDVRRRREFLAVLSEEIVKLRNTLEECDIELTTEIYVSLLRRHLQTLRVPFEGEPLEGIQVMGILETRNLDFEHVILLSMHDDNFPGSFAAQSSFIPYNLRAAYDLPTPEHHEGVYAYYFYRLIQRARTVHMLYCSHADEKSTGEPSRYIRQLDYESGFSVRHVEVGVDVNLAENAPIEVAKDDDVMRSLERFVDPASQAALSPTAFFRYVACPMRFYFYSVAGLRADDEVSEEVDAPMFGTILHAAVQRLYGKVRNELHPSASLRALMHSGEVAQAVEEAINEHYLGEPGASSADYMGNLLLVREIVVRYLRDGVMAYDAANDHFTVTGLEEEVRYDFPFEAGGRALRMKFAGIADRIDRLDDGSLRVVDYKTGTPHLEFDGLGNLFRGEGKQRLSNILQTLLYAMMLRHARGCDAVPQLYYVRRMHGADYSPLLVDRELGVRGAPYSLYEGPFEELVRETLVELFDREQPFRQCADADTCRYCDFNVICRR